MKKEEELQKMLVDYEKEAKESEEEYIGLIDIVRKREIPQGQAESLVFHKHLKYVEHNKISSRARYNLLKFILEDSNV